MRTFTLATLLLPLAASLAVLPGSGPVVSLPAATNQASSSNLEVLDLRQAAALPAGASSTSTSTSTLLPPAVVPTSTSKSTSAPAPAVTPITSITTSATLPVAPPPVPAAPAAPAAPPVAPAGGDSVTVQWVETWISKTRTWVPVTITVHFASVPSQLPGPGKGLIGMGTLTGDTGVTKTVVAAGPTMGVDKLLGGLAIVGAVLGMA